MYSVSINLVSCNKFGVEPNYYIILALLHNFSASAKCQVTVDLDGTKWYWFNWKLIRNQLPVLKIKSRQSAWRKIDKLIELGLLIKKPNPEQAQKSYFRFTEKSDLLFGDPVSLEEIDGQLGPVKKYKKKFQPPTLEVVVAYFLENGESRLKAERFFNYYESFDWYRGKTKMKDWRAAARNAFSWVVKDEGKGKSFDSNKVQLTSDQEQSWNKMKAWHKENNPLGFLNGTFTKEMYLDLYVGETFTKRRTKLPEGKYNKLLKEAIKEEKFNYQKLRSQIHEACK